MALLVSSYRYTHDDEAYGVMLSIQTFHYKPGRQNLRRWLTNHRIYDERFPWYT